MYKHKHRSGTKYYALERDCISHCICCCIDSKEGESSCLSDDTNFQTPIIKAGYRPVQMLKQQEACTAQAGAEGIIQNPA
jgi:hypothetical protein